MDFHNTPNGSSPSKRVIIAVAFVSVLSVAVWLSSGLSRKEEQIERNSSPNVQTTSKTKHDSGAANTSRVVSSADSGSNPKPTGIKVATSESGSAPLLLVPRRVENGYTVLDVPGVTPYVKGEMVTAYFEIEGGKKFKGTPNQLGRYPRILVEPGTAIEVKLDFPDSPAKTPVAVWQEDGGSIGPPDAPVNSTQIEINSARQAGFRFKVAESPGMNRVVFHTPGGQMRILDFWVGPDHSYTSKNS